MKLARFLQDGRQRLGIIDHTGSQLSPIEAGVTDMIDLIGRPDLATMLQNGAEQALPVDRLTLLAPIVPRRNVFCVGKNYHAHAREFAGSGYEAGAVKGAEIDDYPAVFTKPASSVIGPDDTVDLHAHITDSVDYEAELALVIGKPGRDIAKERAWDHIWAYTIINDVTARDRQRNHKQWFMGKALDTFCPMGPWVVTADEIDATNLDIKCWVNGELRQDANTRDLIFDIPTLIATISEGLTLQPGDVIATGTPAGVGLGFTPPRFLKPGDEVSISISGIGTLRSRFA